MTLVAKMLASTMQISNNNPTNPLTHHHRATTTVNNRSPTRQHPCAQAKGGTRRPNQNPRALDPRTQTADPSGPNSVFNHPPTNVRQTPSIMALANHS
ncbi:hypothetical protein NOCA140004 [metagenome]|uniref:Uncharacterized protein n=1 Tax=metagenome TaxID=256318 RepID=A0A2P2CIB0_9ZZZZ